MCCLFGIMDYGGSLSVRDKNTLLSSLAVASEARGVDATGIAYISHDQLRIYKRPYPAHWMRFRIPADATAIIGHTRMTTQGSEEKNFNNHPFHGRAGLSSFALAHNGVLHNDKTIRKDEKLPATNVETDSFIAVQLLEKSGELTPESLRAMAEKIRGSFAFTLLDHDHNLWFVKGDNPICLYHYEKLGLYVYASTKDILDRGLRRTFLRSKKSETISLACGDILRIDRQGVRHMDSFIFHSEYPMWSHYRPYHWPAAVPAQSAHLDEIKSVAAAFGYTHKDVERLASEGFTPDEIEECLYCGYM